MICETLIREALTPDPLEEAKSKVQTRKVASITRQRWEEMHKGALQPLRASVPTARDAGGCSRRAASRRVAT